MSRKFLFIIPPHSDIGQYAKTIRPANGVLPYGVLSIITYVEAYSKEKVIFNILDFNSSKYLYCTKDEMYDFITASIETLKPEIIGISAVFNYLYKYVVNIAKSIKSIQRDIIVIAGGPCALAYYDKILLETPEIDAICCAEGEIPILDLINSRNYIELLRTHPSWITANKIKENVEFKPTFVENLDEIPPINFDIIELNTYSPYRTAFRPDKIEHELCLPIHTTRGCPFNCVFCVASSLHGKKVRTMSAQRVISDVKLMIEKYGMNVLAIEDDQLLIKKDRAKKILKGLSKFHIAIRAEDGLTSSYIDDEMAMLLKNSGMEVVSLAVESGSEYVLKRIIDKPIDLKDIMNAVISLRKYNITINSFLVIGFPEELEEHRLQTIEFIKQVGFDWNIVVCATPFRGSRLYDICAANGYIDKNNFNENMYHASIINTPDFTAEYITKRAYMMNLELNFVNNFRLKIKDFEMAKRRFGDLVNKFPNHAFAHYYLAQALKGLNDEPSIIKRHKDRFMQIVKSEPAWKEYAEYFKLI